MKKKVVAGMSGGVDSSVAAWLLKEQGYEVYGVTMQTWENTKDKAEHPGILEDAARVAEYLGIPHHVIDFHKEFKCKVTDYFADEYLHGRTPNPCIVCNRYVKWESLLEYGRQIGADYIATGHYARIEQLKNGRYAIRNSVTAQKDQTYALYKLTQLQLAHTLMPVGEYEKTAIRDLAVKQKLPVAHKPDSQEICFIPDQDYAGFIERERREETPPPGNFVTKDGEVLGKHKGITHYTIGQRKGLNLAMGHPVFVTRIIPETNEVVIGENEDVFTNELICEDISYMAVEGLEKPARFLGKIRYSHRGTYCTAYPLQDGRVKCVFEEPVRAVTPGQAVVLYEGEHVAMGGTICAR